MSACAVKARIMSTCGLGERVQGKDTALRLSWGEADDDEYGDEGCSRRCPGGAWPFASGFEDTSVEAARQRLEN